MLVAAEPLSTSVMNKLIRAAEAEGCRDAKTYAPNPQALGFSVEDIITLWNTLDDEGISGDNPGATAWACVPDMPCRRLKRACSCPGNRREGPVPKSAASSQ